MRHSSLILILGDQLSLNISSLKSADIATDRILMAELVDEATYVKHHKKKIIFLFSAMRHFAGALREVGWSVDYVLLDDSDNTGSFTGEVERAVARHKPNKIVVTEPGEWRVRQEFDGWQDRFRLPVDILTDDRFICSRAEFADWATGRKQLRMEFFYREMRRKTGLLMDGDKPAGGKWNFDAENRKPAKRNLLMPQPLQFEANAQTQSIIGLVSDLFPDHFGDALPYWFAVNADQATAACDHFVDKALASFGDYQDAMLAGKRFLFHSVLSLYMNAGLLDPLEVCRKVEAVYLDKHIPINAAEGFIRQIIGWREYVRGIYWLYMPEYVEHNHLAAERSLPQFYWTGDTDMACLREVITQTRHEFYAHHIQRLMVTGNFAMLVGVQPRQVHEWYLAVYADAYEWVELPNTLGMSQYADGGLLGSKPYAASGNYINKMSDYCGACRYDVKKKTGEGACPFNPLYWDFLARNEDKLRGNPRLTQVYRVWDRMSDDKRAAYLESAQKLLGSGLINPAHHMPRLNT